MHEHTASRGFVVVEGASIVDADVINVLVAALSDLADANQLLCRLCTAHLLRSKRKPADSFLFAV